MDAYTEDLIETYEYLEDERILYKDSTYDIVSKIAYLIGVPKQIYRQRQKYPDRSKPLRDPGCHRAQIRQDQ